MTRRVYEPETKAAVMSALLTGQSVSSVAKEYEIPKGTVSNWKRRGVKAVGVPSERTQKNEEIGELLVSYLHTMLKTLTQQAEHFADKAWLQNQEADQLAVLHGVGMDKAVRLLEALSSATTEDANTIA